MIRLTLFLFAFMLCSNVFGQSTFRHTVYFETDKATITEEEQFRLDVFLSQILGETIETLKISGHTDSDGSDTYNLNLSERRVEVVKKEFSRLDLYKCEVSDLFFGEAKPADKNTTDIGKQHNRRVDITITLVPYPEDALLPPVPVEIEEEIEGDTTIKYPQGTLIILPKKDYLENPDCIQVVEFLDGESAREAGRTTMTSDGAPLISGGMLDVKMCDENKCITVLIPARTVCGQTVPFTEWTAEDARSAWKEKTGRPLPVRMINDQNYYEMTVCGSGSVNCDLRAIDKKCRLFIPKTRVKLKRGYRIKSIQIASDEPLVFENPIRLRKRKAVFYRICPCTEPLLSVDATNKKGESQTIDFESLNDFDKREAFGKCKTSEVEKKILFFKIVKKTKYRKYIIRETDFAD